jgi:hypothetical protein
LRLLLYTLTIGWGLSIRFERPSRADLNLFCSAPGVSCIHDAARSASGVLL